MKGSIFTTLVLLGLNLFSQVSDWTIQSAGTSVEVGRAIAIDKHSNLIVSGFYNYTADFDPGPGTAILNHWNSSSTINDEAFVVKYDSNGNYIWAKGLVGHNDIEMKDVAVDENDNVITTGHFYSAVDFNPDPNLTYTITTNRTAAFISKLDANGDFVFAKSIQGCSKGLKVLTDKQNNIYIGGNFCYITDFDPDSSSTHVVVGSGTKDAFVLKLDSAGQFLWVQTFTYNYSEDITSMVLDTHGNLYAVGHYYDSLKYTINGQIQAIGSPRGVPAFITKIDAQGDIKWAKNFANGGVISGVYDELNLDITSNGDLIVAGEFKDSLDFEIQQTPHRVYSYDEHDIFMSKLDSNGNVVWLYNLEGKDDQRLADIGVFDDVILLSGMSYDSIDYDVFEPTVRTNYSFFRRGLFLAEYDLDANLKWARSTHSSSYGFLGESLKSANQNIYFTGGFQGQKDFDIGPGTNYISATTWQYDFFLQKVKPCQRYMDTSRITICANDTAFWRGGAFTEAGIHKVLTYDSLGCDSTFVLYLSHLPLDTIHTFESICKGDSLLVNGHFVKTAGIYQEVLNSSQNCDSIRLINLSVDTLNTSVIDRSPRLIAEDSTAKYQWWDCSNNTILLNDTNRTYLANINGSYAVILSKNNCVDTSACYSVINVGIQDLEKSHFISVFPNPVGSKLSIQIAESVTGHELYIYDINQKLVHAEYLNKQISQIDVNHLKRGVYIIKYQSDFIRLIKQ